MNSNKEESEKDFQNVSNINEAIEVNLPQIFKNKSLKIKNFF